LMFDRPSGGQRQCSFLQPVDIEESLGKQPRTINLCESVKIAKRGNHQTPPSTIRRDVMGEAVGLPGGAIAVQGEDGALSEEMRCGFVPVQVCEDGSQRLA